MAKKDSIEQRSANLRKQAEKRLQKQSADQGDIPPEQARQMLHELQVHQIELEMQNEELLHARAEIEASLEKYSDLYDFAPAGYYTLTDKGIIREVNLTGAALLGENRSSLINRQFDLFVSDKTDFFLFLRKVYESNSNETCEVLLSRKKDNPRYIHIEGSVMDVGESMGRYCRVSALDITDRKRAEDLLRVSLAEKEVLLREVHHRVKNNFASIITLLSLHRQETGDPAAKTILTELSGKIESMALIHEKLYLSENLSRIDFQNYLKTLITHLRLSYNGPSTLRYTVAAQGVELDLDDAIACGLIVNELVTNVLKYAFPGNNPRPGSESCELSVSMEWDGSVYTLIVADNGIGLPINLDLAKTKTIGLMLVRMLGENQLGGTFTIDRTGGTRFALTFSPRRTR